MSRITDLELGQLRDVFDEGDCGECGERLAWAFNNSPENPEWTATHCGFTYHIVVSQIEVFRERSD